MRRIVLSVGLIGLAQIAAAQTTQPFVVGDADANAQLTALVETARSNGLPIDPIVAKVEYGRVMKAEPSRIVASARAIAARLSIARDALAPATANDISAGADALGAGATKDALREVRSASGGKSVATPLGVLAQLLGSNVPLKRATEIVTSFMRRGASPEQLVAFGNNVNDDVTHGAAALAALDTRARFLSGVLAPAGSAATAAGLQNAAAPSIPKKP
jgi:hypothetical protein